MGFIIGHHPLKVMQRISFAVLLLIIFTAPAAASSSPSATMGQQARNVVAHQLSAFKTRNAEQAYAAISHTFKEKYKSPLRFATMMRINFWELYSHHAYRFIGQTDGAETQKVEITTESGASYIYLFRLTQAASGDWLIDHVIMLDPQAQPI